MIPKFGYLLVAENVIQDSISKKLTLVDVFENVTIPPDSNEVYNTFFVVGRILNVPPGNAVVKLTINGPSGFRAEASAPGVLIPGSLDVYLKFPLLRFTHTGVYTLSASINNIDIPHNNQFVFNVLKST